MKKTPLFDRHLSLGAKMVDFSGWDMPLHYGSQLQEHLNVRNQVGVFDVSHMGVVDLTGPRVEDLLHWLLANDVSRITEGQAHYSLMLNIRSGVSDDLIVYRQAKDRFFLVVNAGTREKDLAWIRIHAPSYGVQVVERRDLIILAVQGPQAASKLKLCLPETVGNQTLTLKPFQFMEDGQWRISRTGYTGEDGFELMIPAENGVTLWDSLMRVGVAPIGLGARDTLRLEAGMHLYGHDMDEESNPLECGLKWTIAWQPLTRDFIGRQALKILWEEPLQKKRVGLLLQNRGVLRDHQEVFYNEEPVGKITSGGYSPTLEKGIALAQISKHVPIGSLCQVVIRGRHNPALVVRPPFVRFGKPAFKKEVG